MIIVIKIENEKRHTLFLIFVLLFVVVLYLPYTTTFLENRLYFLNYCSLLLFIM